MIGGTEWTKSITFNESLSVEIHITCKKSWYFLAKYTYLLWFGAYKFLCVVVPFWAWYAKLLRQIPSMKLIIWGMCWETRVIKVGSRIRNNFISSKNDSSKVFVTSSNGISSYNHNKQTKWSKLSKTLSINLLQAHCCYFLRPTNYFVIDVCDSQDKDKI